MKIANIAPFAGWLIDLKAGRLNYHQPKRRVGNSKWFVLQRIKENNPLKNV